MKPRERARGYAIRESGSVHLNSDERLYSPVGRSSYADKGPRVKCPSPEKGTGGEEDVPGDQCAVVRLVVSRSLTNPGYTARAAFRTATACCNKLFSST